MSSKKWDQGIQGVQSYLEAEEAEWKTKWRVKDADGLDGLDEPRLNEPFYPLHSHVHQRIACIPGTLLASQYTTQRAVIDLGIYLDYSWLSRFEVATYQSRFLSAWGPKSPALLLVNWPDFDTINLDLYAHLVSYAVRALNAGKVVEVGCFGGHGRTGTLVAGILAKATGMKGGDAINLLRNTYCYKAVETQSQQLLVKNTYR